MDVWPRRLEAFRTARSSAMASSSSSRPRWVELPPGRFELRCCLRAAWVLRGFAWGAKKPWPLLLPLLVLLLLFGRRVESKPAAAADVCGGSGAAGVDEDLMGMDGVKLMFVEAQFTTVRSSTTVLLSRCLLAGLQTRQLPFQRRAAQSLPPP
jgi:hypothetical protein